MWKPVVGGFNVEGWLPPWLAFLAAGLLLQEPRARACPHCALGFSVFATCFVAAGLANARDEHTKRDAEIDSLRQAFLTLLEQDSTPSLPQT